ncbi:MAG: hypothetical protein HY869_16750 [Chloroflexi bacterium]|nr:hypothetical protein [Chloroflexota bacterium]
MKSEKKYIRIYQMQAAVSYLGLVCWALPPIVAGRLHGFELIVWVTQIVLLPYILFTSVSKTGRFGVKKYILGIVTLTLLSLFVFSMLCLFGVMNFLLGIGNIIAAGISLLIAFLGIWAFIDYRWYSKPRENKDIQTNHSN